MTSMTYIWIGVLALLGWLLAYLFIRQLFFNCKTAYPVLKKMKEADENLIVFINAKRYTTISMITCILVFAVFSILVIILKFIKLPMKIGFFAGALICVFMLLGKTGPEHQKMFESFCAAYYRFVPDDQLRTDMYNLKVPAMKLRCHDMNVSTDWIPDFVKED